MRRPRGEPDEQTVDGDVVAVADEPGEEGIVQSATNIERAVENALENLAPHHLKRLVLMTDGNENTGRMRRLAARLKKENVQVYAVPLNTRANRDVWIESLMAPSQVASEQQFPVEVHVYSQDAAMAHIELR